MLWHKVNKVLHSKNNAIMLTLYGEGSWGHEWQEVYNVKEMGV